MSQSKISRIETGSASPTPEDVEAFVRGLDQAEEVVSRFRLRAEALFGRGIEPHSAPAGRFQGSGAVSATGVHRAEDSVQRWDFFISYTAVDRPWAEWVAWHLEEVGYRVLFQAWDFVVGSHWTSQMGEGVIGAERTLAILSRAYLDSVYGQAEWQAAYRADPQGLHRKLIPVRIEDCDRPGILGQVVSFDLFGLPAEVARQHLLDTLGHTLSGRAKPKSPPSFPTSMNLSAEAAFPDLERQARRIFSFQPSLVPGLLQTTEYARRVFSLFHTPYPEREIPAAVAGRLDRQMALYEEDRKFHFMITEAALRWRPGRPNLLLAQLDRIALVSTLDNVSIGLIPHAVEAATSPTHGFVIFDFGGGGGRGEDRVRDGDGDDEDLEKPDDDSIVTIEITHANLTVKGEFTAPYRHHWSLLRKMAIFDDEARAFLAEVSADIRKLGG